MPFVEYNGNLAEYFDRQILLFGDKRYIMDFLYIFDGTEARVLELNELDNLQDSLLIVCTYRESEMRKELEKAGVSEYRSFRQVKEDKKKSGYIMAYNLFCLLDFPIREIAEERNVYIWGTGKMGKSFLQGFLVENPDISIRGYVDSNPKGDIFLNRPVINLEEALADQQAYFIIAVNEAYCEISELLQTKGKLEQRDYIHISHIHHQASQMLWETIYGVPKMKSLCKNAFYDARMERDAKINICCGIQNAQYYGDSIFYANFENIWHSNILKVLRLSMVNGTYSFCNPKQCDLLRNAIKEETHSQFDILSEDHYRIKEAVWPKELLCTFDLSCNLHCASCRNEVYIAKGRELDKYRKLADQVKEKVLPNIEKIKLLGLGEVFASQIGREFIFSDSLSGNIRKLSIISNGTMLTPEYLNRIIGLWQSIHVSISMDGATKETAEKLRRGLNFDKWKENMVYLGEMRKCGKIDKLMFNFVVQRENYLEMSDFVEMCLEFHADVVKFSPVFNWGNWTQQEYERISMTDENGNPNNELAAMIDMNPILKKPEVRLFTWEEW